MRRRLSSSHAGTFDAPHITPHALMAVLDAEPVGLGMSLRGAQTGSRRRPDRSRLSSGRVGIRKRSARTPPPSNQSSQVTSYGRRSACPMHCRCTRSRNARLRCRRQALGPRGSIRRGASWNILMMATNAMQTANEPRMPKNAVRKAITHSKNMMRMPQGGAPSPRLRRACRRTGLLLGRRARSCPRHLTPTEPATGPGPVRPTLQHPMDLDAADHSERQHEEPQPCGLSFDPPEVRQAEERSRPNTRNNQRRNHPTRHAPILGTL